ncbi:hypothetical protein CDV55_105215 [Aspergillus turcosus]|uniref:USP domain-containing protein n=1 Tax=Aspergillus turcosus TaxID=1245748 RepID=A0A229YUX8_9EURO|nr:hypothetical protein CDV55_105215 [Aspergillus turcosus]RLL95698.1 hypothetical protein CFD26_103011 [Aspergillus turcosus]
MANQPTFPAASLPQQGAVCAAWKHVSLNPSESTRGFNNPPGLNLCYRNAALTLFLHTPEFLRWCDTYRGQTPSDSIPEVVRRLYGVIVAYWTYPNGPEQALESLWTELQNERYGLLRWQTTVGTQHDAFEMLENIISLVDDQTSQSYDRLVGLMTAAVSECRVCKTCKRKDSRRPDNVRFLRADLPAASIEDAIISGMKSETLSDCKTCATKEIPHEIQCRILLPSDILFVQVNRFNGSRKLQDEIEVREELVIPDSILDDSLKGQGKIGYELYAVIFHIGATIANGHYTAAVKGPSGQWVMTNDKHVTPPTQTLDESMTDGGKKNAYILAYRRVESQSNSADSNTDSSAAVAPSSPKASSTGQSSAPSGNPIADSSKASNSGKGSVKGGVQMKATIELQGRPIQWTINQQLVLDPDKGALVALKDKARTQRATLQLTFTSEETGEVLEGQVTMSLKPRRVQKPKRAASKTADAKDSSAGTEKATDTASIKAAKPKGVTKKVSSPRKGTRKSARLRGKAEK